ncbi:hypothetical protein BJV82DRAFT_145143 [Fennellomyces sp. T-0311]|nr:hypothetical protein BJV82DRAFT_145143 [Fennellomyces sp. T-0311]
MNRKPTTSETNTKPTTKGVSNYAAAAKRSSQIQDQQPQQRSSTAQSNASTSVNQSTKGKGRDASVNGKNTGDSAPQSAVNEETSDMTTPPNTMARKQNQAKNARNASVQLPRAPPQDVAPIQFGSINQVTEPVPVSSIRDDGSPILNTTEVTFGTMPASDGSNHSQPYMPHQKKTISPHMQTAQSPAVSGQNMIGHVWPSPGPAPHTGYVS